jgi:hypothetical protein
MTEYTEIKPSMVNDLFVGDTTKREASACTLGQWYTRTGAPRYHDEEEVEFSKLNPPFKVKLSQSSAGNTNVGVFLKDELKNKGDGDEGDVVEISLLQGVDTGALKPEEKYSWRLLDEGAQIHTDAGVMNFDAREVNHGPFLIGIFDNKTGERTVYKLEAKFSGKNDQWGAVATLTPGKLAA